MGQIHDEAERVHFATNPRDRELLKPFLSCFDVTWARLEERGRDKVLACYLRPEHFMAELLGLEREMLLIYAPFPEFQARTLKLHDQLLARDRVRLDSLGSVIIGDDADTPQVVQEYLTTDPERPPIVALSTVQVRALRDSNDVKRLFLEQLYKRDVFAVESPLLSDQLFFGRQDITTELLDRHRSGQNSGLFGLRRIGKTSVLYALQRRAAAANVATTVYLDVSSPAFYGVRWWELLQEIVRKAVEPLGLQRADRSKTRALTVTYGEHDAAKHLKADFGHIQHVTGRRRLFILLDEIEYLTFDLSPAQHWAGDFLPFWQTLRSLHQESTGELTFIVAGVNPRILEVDRIGNLDNPLFSTVRPYYLKPFDRSTLREMVRRLGRYMGLTCEEALFDRLYEEYGGHPFLVRQACSHLARHVAARPSRLSVDLLERQRASVAVPLERNVRQILNVLAIWYPQEYELIRLLAAGDRSTFMEFSGSNAGFTEHVEGYGLILSAREDPRITIHLVEAYLASQPPPAPAAAEPEGAMPTVPNEPREDLLARISRRRNAVELRLRELLRTGLRFSLGKKAGDGLLLSLATERRAVVAQYSYDDTWEQLYFDELRGILDKHWPAFQNLFGEEKTKVLQWLEHVNRCRADAHARTLSDDDLAYLNVCFRRLEEALDSVVK